MHEMYRTLATDIQRDRMREAADWRLADEARRRGRATGRTARLHRLLAAVIRQPTPTPTLSSETAACGS
jgi:hypothetical protein